MHDMGLYQLVFALVLIYPSVLFFIWLAICQPNNNLAEFLIFYNLAELFSTMFLSSRCASFIDLCFISIIFTLKVKV